jgi:hypothetical protein
MVFPRSSTHEVRGAKAGLELVSHPAQLKSERCEPRLHLGERATSDWMEFEHDCSNRLPCLPRRCFENLVFPALAVDLGEVDGAPY